MLVSRVIRLALLAMLLGSQESSAVGPGRGSQGDPCAATGSASMAASADIRASGPHSLVMTSASPVNIAVGTSWGGGSIAVPSAALSCTLVIIAAPPNVALTGVSSVAQRFRVVSMTAHAASITYPSNIPSGTNSFSVGSDTSYVWLSDTTGIAILSGGVDLTFTNSLFPAELPATVRATLDGTYDFGSRVATLSTVAFVGRAPDLAILPILDWRLVGVGIVVLAGTLAWFSRRRASTSAVS